MKTRILEWNQNIRSVKSLIKLPHSLAALATILFGQAAYKDFKPTLALSCMCMSYIAAHSVTNKCKFLI